MDHTAVGQVLDQPVGEGGFPSIGGSACVKETTKGNADDTCYKAPGTNKQNNDMTRYWFRQNRINCSVGSVLVRGHWLRKNKTRDLQS